MQKRKNRRPTALRLTPYAWAKLLYLRDAGPGEVGGFGIASPDDLLLIEDVALVRQTVDRTSVVFDDEGVADYFERQVEVGLPPARFGRVWIHTHPGRSALPSAVDEETFRRVFGRCDWAVMAIVARSGASYARLAFGVGPGGELELPVEVAFETAFAGSDRLSWQAEFERSVTLRAEPAEESFSLLDDSLGALIWES
ncbi:MAG: hypothetical protein C0485_17555 [Pirellula sp.]|nr:hypothetical protein [Pirellula sp.]